MDKRGILMENVIFIILNLVFFAILLIFIFNSLGGIAVYQQAYAKQIALIIDQMKPATSVLVNMDDAIGYAKNKFDKSKIVNIDEKQKKVIVSLGSSTGYSYNYFNSASIKVRITSNGGSYFLLIEAGKNA